jgi:hypothetical protein
MADLRMKLVVCKCGDTHECAARMSNHERAVKAARSRAGVAQTEERLPRKQQVAGSTPAASSKEPE